MFEAVPFTTGIKTHRSMTQKHIINVIECLTGKYFVILKAEKKQVTSPNFPK